MMIVPILQKVNRCLSAVPYFKRASLFLIMKTYWGDKLSICLEGPLIFPGRSTPVQLPHEQSLTLNLSDREQSARRSQFLKNTFYDKKYNIKNLRSVILLAIKLKSAGR